MEYQQINFKGGKWCLRSVKSSCENFSDLNRSSFVLIISRIAFTIE